MTPEFRARAALFRWLWVVAGGLCLRLTAGNVFCVRSDRPSFFCSGRELWSKFDIFLPDKVAHAFFWCIWLDFLMISHWMVCSILLSFSSKICSLSFVSLFLCTSLNDDLCWLYVVLNSLSVSPR